MNDDGQNEHSLPDGWELSTLGESCDVVLGQSPSSDTYNVKGVGLPFYQGKTEFGDLYPTPEKWCSSPKKLAEKDDILISVRAPVGPTNVADIECCIGRGLAAIRPRNEADRDFVLLALKLYENELAQLGSGSTFAAIKRDQLEGFEIPLPPLLKQQRIAAVLNEQMAAVEKARAAAQAQLGAARALPAAYLREVFEGEEARGWERVRLGDLLTLRKEIIHPYDNPSGPAVFVGLEHIESGTGARAGKLEVEMSQLTGRKPKFYKGDIVYGYLRPYLNKVWVAEFDGLCSVDQYVYSVLAERAETDFIAWFMRSATYLNRAPITTTPGQLPRIRTEEVASVEINLPPLPMQRRILARLGDQLTQAQKTSAALEAQLAAIEQLPGALLRRAFAGEL